MTKNSVFLSVILTGILMSACGASEARQTGAVVSSGSSSVSAKSTGLKRFPPKKITASSAPAVVTPPQNKAIPILVYHHVRPQQGWGKSTWSWKMTVTAQTFEKQLKWMTDHGYTSIDLDTYVAIMKGETAGPEKPVVLTFDDNNTNQYTAAFPLLKKYNMISVIYIVTGRIGPSTLTEEQIKEMSAAGMDIQSHTITHRVLTALPQSEIDREFSDSRKKLEELLGKPIRHVAYPGTAHNLKVRERAAAMGYTTATIMDPRTATEKDDFFKLPRIMMTDDTNLEKVLP